MQLTVRLILIAIISFVCFLILMALVSATLRRLVHSWKYRQLDRYREVYKAQFIPLLQNRTVLLKINDFVSSPQSNKFQAIEEVLLDLMNEDRYRDEIRTLFYKLGYVAFYEKKLRSRNIIIRASAVDKLGKMLSEPSVGKLIEMLKTKNTETIAVTVRALSKIKSTEALKGILDHLPTLLHESLIAQKAMNTALTSFGVSAVPPLIEYGRKHSDPRILSSILEVLSNTSADSAVCLFAVEHIKHSDADIRAKALKVLGNVDTESIAFEQNLVLPLLEDPVWFVRLQAVRALGNLHYRKAIDFMGGLLLDQNWQVRDAAATALTKFGNDSIDIFLKILKYRDLYAKESICEEIEKTNFSSMLIENLASENREIQAKSREILHVMHSLHFSTPLREYLKRSKNEAIGQEIRLLINEGSEA